MMKICNFNECFKDITGGNAKIKQSDYLDRGRFPIVDQGKNLIGGYSNIEDIVSRKGAVIIFGDHTGIFKYIDFDFILGADGVKVIEPNYSILFPKYAYYILSKAQLPDTGYDRKFKYLKRLVIPLPPLETQKKIAAILDAADEFRQKTKALIEKYDQLAQSLFLEMFGDLTINSKRWDELMLGDVLELITYGLTVRPNYIKLGVPLISAREIRTGKIDFESAPKISFEDFESLTDKGKPKKNDILFSKTGSIGHCSLVDSDELFAITQNAARLTFRKSINSYFALHYLRSSFIQELSQRSAKGNAVKDLQLGEMKKFKFLNPPITLQSQFSERIQLIETQKQQAQTCLQKAEELFNSLLQRAFNGEL